LLESYLLAAVETVELEIGSPLVQRPATWTLSRNESQMPNLTSGLAALQFFLPQSWNLTMTQFFLFPTKGSSVSSVTLNYWDGSFTTLTASTDYYIDQNANPVRIKFLNYDAYDYNVDNVQMAYNAGLFATVDLIPATLKVTILEIATSLYVNRGEAEFTAITRNVERVLNKYRSYGFANANF
jgi:hypothetical protein